MQLNLPAAATKKELQHHYNKFSIIELRSIWNEVIATNRNISLDEAKNVKTLRLNEVREVMKELGDE